jgi:hypothetical protein
MPRQLKQNISDFLVTVNRVPEYRDVIAAYGYFPMYLQYGESSGLQPFLNSLQTGVLSAVFPPVIDDGVVTGHTRVALWVLIILSTLYILALLWSVIRHRETRVIHSANPLFCGIFLCGCLLFLIAAYGYLAPASNGKPAYPVCCMPAMPRAVCPLHAN